MARETITTERLILEPWSEGIREDWIALNADPRVASWLGTGEPIERAHSEPEFEWMLEHWDKHGFGWRSIVGKDSGLWMGAVGLSYLDDNPAGLPPEGIEIGWWLKPEYWGGGLATEGAIATRNEGFSEGITDHIWARHTARNIGSGRIMEKIGMTYVRDGAGVQGVLMRIYELSRERWESLSRSP